MVVGVWRDLTVQCIVERSHSPAGCRQFTGLDTQGTEVVSPQTIIQAIIDIIIRIIFQSPFQLQQQQYFVKDNELQHPYLQTREQQQQEQVS